GLILSIFALLFGFGAGYGLERLSLEYPHYNGVEIVALSLFITAGSVWFSLLLLYFALEKSGKVVEGAYFAISRSSRANLNASDDFGITRLGINFSAKSFDKGLVSPVFWYLIAGLPAVGLYAALAMLSWRFAKDGQDKGLSQVPVALEKLLGFVPSAFAALIITAASAIAPTAKIGGSLNSWFGMKDRAAYAQGGFPLSALAWALSVSIGGPYQDLDGKAVKAPWVGPQKATAKNDYKHLRRALIINAIAHALFVVILASAYLWSQTF
ncbi:MAG: cobalamin biosynthesis protein, partial [Pseudomonadota bacterium]